MVNDKSRIEEIPDSSDAVREVMTHIPHWIIRWGMTGMLGIILVLLAISWFIKYPDVLTSQVVLTTANPPARIVARVSGKITQIYFRENDLVAAGTILASIENPAASKDVLRLRQLLQAVPDARLVKEQSLDLPENIQLGELQKEYGLFYRAYQELKFFKTLNPVAREITATGQEMGEYRHLLEKQLREKELLQTEVQLARKDYDRNVFLYQNKVIADKQLEDNERELIRTRRSYEQLESGIATTRIRLSELQKSLAMLAVQNAQESSQYELSLTEAHKTLVGAVAQWEQQYLLRSPVAGQVTYLKFWAPNQYVRSGEEVMVIVPRQQQALIGKVSMPIQNSGKVKVGQRVNIYLKNFPHQEFGTLPGRVSSISLVPAANRYTIGITLPAGLKTSYHKQLVFKQEMQGNAEIVTEELRLLERIFYQVRALGKGN
jgi:multidrug resistance efflux pump